MATQADRCTTGPDTQPPGAGLLGPRAQQREWITDITYVRTTERWLYLCVVTDLYSRKVVGW